MHARLGLGEARAEAHRVEAALMMTPPRPGLGSNLGTAALLNALAILWLADANVAKARPLLRTATGCPGQLAPGKMLDRLLTGDPAEAVRSVAGLLAQPGHTVRSVAAVDTLGAAAAMRAGNEGTALKLLERAASQHELFGVRAHLAYLPGGDLEALRDLARRTGSAPCEAYLAADVVSPIGSVESPPVQLTRREIEVLSAWAVHRTRADVAAALFVSANTVRSQLNSAYRKLGVTTKDAAIQRAVELDLLRRATR
jgi:LuxR family maltose regulon positive regulatory protein